MNDSVIDEKANKLLKTILDAYFKSEYLNALIFRLGTFYKGAAKYFICYIQPFFILSFAILLLVTFVVSYKQKMIGVFQAILLLSNFVEILAPLLISPIVLIFTFFSDVNVPMPYPACLIFYNLTGPFRGTLHIIAQYLHLLIGINRICAVYKPFKLRFWFSKKRTAIYCSSIISVGVVSGIIMNIYLPKTGTKKWVDDVWLTGNFEVYTACIYKEIYEPSTLQIHLNLVVITIAFLPPLAMIFMNIALVLRFRDIKNKRSRLKEVQGQNEVADKRTDAMNKIALLIMLTLIGIELPLIAIKVYGWIAGLETSLYGIAKEETHNAAAEQAVAIIFDFLFPFDLAFYVILSGKLRRAIKQYFLKLCKCRK